MREWAEIRLEDYPKSSKTPESRLLTTRSGPTLELAELISMQLNRDDIDAVSVLAALLKPGVAFSADQLKTFPATQKEIMDAAVEESNITQAIAPEKGKQGNEKQEKGGAGNALYKYCKDKTSLAEEGKLDPIIGRDKEIRMVLEVLGRRSKPNVIIVGEPGVGKTALVDGLAQMIVSGNIPQLLRSPGCWNWIQALW